MEITAGGGGATTSRISSQTWRERARHRQSRRASRRRHLSNSHRRRFRMTALRCTTSCPWDRTSPRGTVPTTSRRSTSRRRATDSREWSETRPMRPRARPRHRGRASRRRRVPGTNCIEIGLPGKLILSKSKGLQEVLFS